MAKSVNEEWLDAMLRHQIGLLRLSGSISNRSIEILNSSDKKAKQEILLAVEEILDFDGIPGQSRTDKKLAALLVSLLAERGGAWDEIEELWVREGTALALAEPEFLSTALKTVAPVTIALKSPSSDLLKAIATSMPFEGHTLSEWANGVKRADLDRVMSEIRIGLIQGDSTRTISQRVFGTVALKGADGVTQIARRDINGIVRTAVIHISNQARRAFLQANEDVFDEELYVATLDSRTTPICRSLDGKRFPVGIGPIPPIHFNCRSTRVGVIGEEAIGTRPAKPVTEKQLVRRFAASNDLGQINTRGRLPYGWKGKYDAFARAETRKLVGQVPAKLTYQEWLGGQSVEFQNDVLGPTRGVLFRKGGLTLDKFVNRQGDELTLSELATFNANAFRMAGLDPGDF